MKKSLLLVAFFAAVAMASTGGTTLLAHAQSASNATLQQQLDDAKAQLVQLQMQAGQVPTGDMVVGSAQPVTVTVTPVAPTMTVTPSVSLSAADVAQMNTALTALANLLVTLQAKSAQDPNFISSNGPVVVSALQTISKTVAVIGSEMTGSNVAMTTPSNSASAGTAPATGVAQATPGQTGAGTSVTATVQPTPATAPVAQVTPTTPTVVNPAPAAAAPQTAQTASAFSFSQLNWPLIIVIILIVAAIAIWLWWDDGDEKNQPVVKISSPNPQKPMQQPLQQSNQNSNANRPQQQPTMSSQTPLSSAVAPNGNR